jgi:hypothetical protein
MTATISQSCKDLQSLNTGSEPMVTVWDSVDCAGNVMTFQWPTSTNIPANVNILVRDSAGIPTTIGWGDISTMAIPGTRIVGIWVPLQFEVTLFGLPNFQGRSIIIPSGASRINLSSPNYGIGQGEVRSITITRLMSWKDAQLGCCLGDSSIADSITSGNCKTYWGPGQAVASIYDENAALSDCDSIMTRWCAMEVNRGDPNCACVQSTVKDIAACYDPACTNSAAYQTTNQKTLLNGGCPDKIVCEQYIKIGAGASDNIINAKMYQICPTLQQRDKSTNATTGAGGTPVTSTTQPTPIKDPIIVNDPGKVIYDNPDDAKNNTIIANTSMPGDPNRKKCPSPTFLGFLIKAEEQQELCDLFGDQYEYIIIGIVAVVILAMFGLLISGKEDKRPMKPNYQPNYQPNYSYINGYQTQPMSMYVGR